MNSQQKEKIDKKKQWRKDKIRDSITLLSVAKEMFNEFDKNGNGSLEGDEILRIADWIFDVYAPDGFEIRKREKIYASNGLVDICDKNQDGALDFAEFAEWVLQTMNLLKKLVQDRELKENEDYSSGDGNAMNESPIDQQMMDGFDSEAQLFSKTLKSKQQTDGFAVHNRSKSEGDKIFSKTQYEYGSAKKGDPTAKLNESTSTPQGSTHRRYQDESDEKMAESGADFVRVELPVKLLNSPDRKVTVLVPAGSEKKAANPWRKEEWSALLYRSNRKFSQPARTGVQLFLRLCQAGEKKDHVLKEADVQELFRISGSPPNQQKIAAKLFLDFFNSSEKGRITMTEFARKMPHDANEYHLWLLLQEVKTVAQKR